MLINHTPYNICGVVEDVSNLASFSYADIWVPFTSTTVADFRWCEYMGGLSMIMLAKDPQICPRCAKNVIDYLMNSTRKPPLRVGSFFISSAPTLSL